MRLSHGEQWHIVMQARQAYQQGQGIADCPYEEGNPRREAWLAGLGWAYELGLKREAVAEHKTAALAKWKGGHD